MRPGPDLQSLILSIYDAAASLGGWPQPMAAITDVLGAGAMSLHVIGPDGKTLLLVAPRTDPQWLRVYGQRWSGSNMVRERGLVLPVGAIYQFESLMARYDFEGTEFYNEFWAPQHHDFALFSNLADDPEAIAGIGFYRSARDGPFTPDEESTLHALVPHLQRALNLNLRFGQIEMERDWAVEMLNRCRSAALLVDHQARILQTNAAAELLLCKGKGLYGQTGRLAARTPSDTALLRAMIAGNAVARLSSKLILRDGETYVLSLQIWPVQSRAPQLAGRRAAAVVFAEESAERVLPSPELLRALFQLTPAQASLAREILQGDGVAAAARRLGISRATARTHLLQCFQRTGTSRQAELVRVMLQRTLPLLGDPNTARGATAAGQKDRAEDC